MSIVEVIDRVLGTGSNSVQLKVFECADCDSTFESAKQPDRASCPECLSNDVTQVGTADR